MARQTVNTGKPADTSSWPEGVRPIGIGQLDMLGVHLKSKALYWDGREIVTRRIVRLRGFELFLATLAAAGTFGVFVLECGKLAGWWAGAP